MNRHSPIHVVTFADPLMTKAAVAELLHCSERTLERRYAANDFPPPMSFGKEALWFESVVNKWLERQRANQERWLAQTAPASPSAVEPATETSLASAQTPRTEPEPPAAAAKPRVSRSKPRRDPSASIFSDAALAIASERSSPV